MKKVLTTSLLVAATFLSSGTVFANATDPRCPDGGTFTCHIVTDRTTGTDIPGSDFCECIK